ncbi:DUF488 domain-containing protein [Nitrosospira multiformis]|uniref:DUF488 domain-containing protein n=1 Tax=Nitrosospira multiformis TaxID=1231 RepID=UPI0008981346|nr:DUF488 domain-containing protein [Nitrosospira multiformis]SDZ97375.1 Protein of unknown function, DUF488 [Nitrosospira multiformis]
MEATTNNMKDAAGAEPFICTIGHSTHPLEEFINLLKKNEVTHLLDVRTVPRSRHNPQFNKETLPDALGAIGIKYTHLPGLGGLRHARKDSINEGWRNASFRGYADYMQTQEFVENVNRVIELAVHDRCALMCAEAVPWRCHRSLIADALVVRGVRVEDIIDNHGRKPHSLTPWAQAEGVRIFYPAQQGRLI